MGGNSLAKVETKPLRIRKKTLEGFNGHYNFHFKKREYRDYYNSIMNTLEYDHLRNLAFCLGCTRCGAFRGSESPECKKGHCEWGRSPELYVMRRINSKRDYRVQMFQKKY